MRSFARFLVVAVALSAAAIGGALALSGTDSRHQNEQLAVGRLQLGMGSQAGSNTPSFNNGSGVITTAALSTAAGASQAITLTNTNVAVGDVVLATLDNNGSAGTPALANASITANTITFTIQNIHASVALNAAVKIYFVVIKTGNANQ